MKFEVLFRSKKSRARVGRIHTPHGIIETPAFVPVGTNGALKALDSVAVSNLETQIMFCNTYHLMIQPGEDIIEKAGGLHKFMNRTGPIITDSGGFQVFSLLYGGVAQELKSKGTKKRDSGVVKITEEGVTFRSYRDGRKIEMTAETSIGAQKKIGADLIVAFDELPPYHLSPENLKKSFERTHRWEKRSLDAHKADPRNQAMYAVIHGGMDRQLRKKSCQILGDQDFDGFGIGGSVGKDCPEMLQLLTDIMPFVPDDRPNHLLGIADLPALAGAIPLGVDTFDSAHPTKCARHGMALTKFGGLRILKSGNEILMQPIEIGCECYTCQNYTVAYINHLFKAHEMSAYTLMTIHNLHYMNRLMKKYRQDILDGLI